MLGGKQNRHRGANLGPPREGVGRLEVREQREEQGPGLGGQYLRRYPASSAV